MRSAASGRPDRRRSPSPRTRRAGARASGSPASSGASARPRARRGAAPGVQTSAPQPAGREAMTPARTNDVLPAPEGPITASSRRSAAARQSASTSASRPKKTAASFSVKDESPGYGLPRPRRPPSDAAPGRRASTASSASARSCAPWKRSSRSFSRHRRTIPSSAGGIAAVERRQVRRASPAGSPSACAATVSRRKGWRRDEQLVEHDAEGEDVAPRVDRQRLHLLGRHVRHRPHQDAGAASSASAVDLAAVGGRAARELRQAEVEDLDPPVGGEEEVLGLEVAVDDPLLVGGGEALGGLDGPGRGSGVAWASGATRTARSVSPSSSSVTT